MLSTRHTLTRLAYRANRSCMRSLATQTASSNTEIDSFISQLHRSRGDSTQFQSLISQAPTVSEKAQLSDRLLRSVTAESSNASLLHLALKNIQYDQVSADAITNLINIINTIRSTNVFGPEVPKLLTNLFLSLSVQGPNVIALLETAVEKGGSRTSRTILTLCYIRTHQLDKAFKLIQRLTAAKLKIDSSAMELLIIHHCHHEQLMDAAILLKTATENDYEVYPRTYTELISKAIELGHWKVCLHNYKKLITHSYVSNEMIVSLAELLARRITPGEMSELVKIFNYKESMPPGLKARLRIAITENFANESGYTVGFDYLKKTHLTGALLRVDDFPTLVSKFVISKDLQRAMKTTVTRSYHPHSKELKRFELAMLVKKAVQDGRLSFVLQIFKENIPTLSHLISGDCLNQMIKGLKTTTVQKDFDMFMDVFIASNATLRTRWAVDALIKSMVDSEYWFKVFKLFPRVDVEGYKLHKKTLHKLRCLLETHGFNDTEHSIPKKFLDE